ncbi:MAG: hypothetical protein PVS3B1_28490 [Ktedonobacteraceae bacterium]
MYFAGVACKIQKSKSIRKGLSHSEKIRDEPFCFACASARKEKSYSKSMRAGIVLSLANAQNVFDG